MKNQSSEILRQRKLRKEIKREDASVDMKDWIRRNSKVKLSELARPMYMAQKSFSFEQETV